MHQRVGERGNAGRLPDRTQIADLLCRYSEPLLSSCPSSETLVVYHEDRKRLNSAEREAVSNHQEICLDCQDKLRWLKVSEDTVYTVHINRVIWYVLKVHHPTGMHFAPRKFGVGGSDASAGGTSRAKVPRLLPSDLPGPSGVPCVVSGDGALYGEVRQDRRRRLYLKMIRLPRSFQWHALHIRAMTFDRELLIGRTRTIASPSFYISHPPRITPGDLDRFELGLIPLR